MNKIILGILCCLISADVLAQDKETADKLAGSSQPGFFHELMDTETLCMAACPYKMDSVFGLKLICGNFDEEGYQKTCSNITSDQPVVYCNCYKGDCTKFKVSCIQASRICAVEITDSELAPSSCKCNGNSCQPPPGNFAESICFMREVPSTNVCGIERTVAFNAGRTYQISCKDGASKCESEGVQIRNEETSPNLSLPKPSEPK